MLEPGLAGELRPAEPGLAEAGVSGGGVAEGIEEVVEEGFGEGGAAVVDVGAGGQAGQVGVAVGVGQVGKACGMAGDVDAAAARPGSPGWCHGHSTASQAEWGTVRGSGVA